MLKKYKKMNMLNLFLKIEFINIKFINFLICVKIIHVFLKLLDGGK